MEEVYKQENDTNINNPIGRYGFRENNYSKYRK